MTGVQTCALPISKAGTASPGIVTPGDAVPAFATNRILYRDGIPVAVKEGEGRGERFLLDVGPEEAQLLRSALVRRRVAPLVQTYLGKTRAGT